jgi:Na+-driven multidrug efflux pump
MGRLLRIGAPTSVNTVLFSVVYLFLSKEAAALGTGPLAALGVGNRVESVSYLAASALAVAAATMVGQNLGGGSQDRARRTARIATIMGLSICTFWGIAFFVGARPIIGLFSRDPAVLEPGVGLLRVIAICQPLMGIEIALAGAFQGAGYTLVPMSISSGISILRIPAAAVSTRHFGWGFSGIAWVISITCLARGFLMLLVYRSGSWLGRSKASIASGGPA